MQNMAESTEALHDSSLIRALDEKDWELCRKLLTCDERSRFLRFRNHGWSASHWACRHNAPVDVVFATCREMRDSLVDDSSEGQDNDNSVLIMDRYGRTPLHLACWYASEEVIACVIDLLPVSATLPNHDHERRVWQLPLPLHVAVRCRRSPSVIKRLLDVHPRAARTANTAGRTPLDNFFRLWKRDVTRNAPRFSGLVYGPREDGRIPGKQIVEGTYSLLVQAYTLGTVSSDVGAYNTLHQAVRIKGTPPVFYMFLMKVMSKEAVKHDPDSNFVLHIACSGPLLYQDCHYDSDSDGE